MPEMASVPPDNPQNIPVNKPSYSSIVQKSNPNPVNSPVSPRTAKKTFNNSADIFHQQGISALPPEIYQNHPAAVFFTDEIATFVEKLKWQLVGKFNKMPSFDKVKAYFQNLQLSGNYSVQWYNYRHVFIKLSNEFDYATVRRRPVVDFDKEHRMRVLKWDTKFSPEKESSIVPVWITFPFLPNHLYNKEALRILAQTLGTPLQMDDPTSNGTRPSHPRVCIEVDCLKPPPGQIFVHFRGKQSGLNEDGFWQKVIFEKIPSYCNHCHILGHDIGSCKLVSNNPKAKGKQNEGKRVNTEYSEDPNVSRGNNNRGKGTLLEENSLQPSEMVTNKQKINTKGPYLTDNWEIGNRKRDKEDPLKKDIANSFQEKHQVSDLQTCAINYEASVPGSSTFEEGECFLPKSSKNPPLQKRSVLEEDALPSSDQEQNSARVDSLLDSSKGRNNLEEKIKIVDRSDEEDDLLPVTHAGALEKNESVVEISRLLVNPVLVSPLPEPGNPLLGLPEKVGVADTQKSGSVTSNQAELVPELGLVDRGVAQENPSEAEANLQKKATAVPASSAATIAGGPSCSNPVPKDPLDIESAQLSYPRDVGHPVAQPSTSLSPTKVAAVPDAQPKAHSASPNSPEAHCNIGPVPKDQKQEGIDASPGESQTESNVVDNWVLSERREARRKSELNKDAASFYPSMSWIEDGEDAGPELPQFERNFCLQGDDDLSDRDAGSDFSTYSEFREYDEELEDDFTVHPPRKWNSTNNLQQMHLSPRLTPPVTRSKGIKIGKGKNKLRW